MILIPAIDLRDGNVVRLLRGDYTQEKVYTNSPKAVAERWIDAGAEMIHMVDLDGARDGVPANLSVVTEVAKCAPCPVQFGGGLRTPEAVSATLAAGVSRVVIGTKGLDTDLLRVVLDEHGPEKIVVGLDAFNGSVKTEGWLKDSGYSVEDACERIVKAGIKHVVFTDIACDGTLQGPNIESLKKVLSFSELQVVASGGIGSLDDLRNIAALECPNVFGIIIGKALYEEVFTLPDAIKCIKTV